MSQWGATRARQVLSALLRVGWQVKRESKGSHMVLSREGWADVVWAFHDREVIGPAMLARIARNTGLTPDDL
jgi:predicted RNA binding protein YcfA (HicA-like mRNA interferase family)